MPENDSELRGAGGGTGACTDRRPRGQRRRHPRGAAVEQRLDGIERRLADLEERLDELDAGLQTVQGYIGEVEHVNREVERQAEAALATLAEAHKALAEGAVSGDNRAPGRAVRLVAGPKDPVEVLTTVLTKHTRGHGVLADVFGDPGCSDAFLKAPAGERPLRVRVDGEAMRTNVRMTERGAETLASRYRRTTGRSFSRADPTLDATARAGGRRVRVAGVTAPASDGVALAFRAHDRGAWTLPSLVANGTLTSGVAGLLSVAVERGATCLLAGARGAGKTTALGALCFELPAATRALVIEDTPELPVARLREAGRDVQALQVGTGPEASLSPAAALRTALRMGDGALVVGEVRGEEAGVLFEAMRVGAADGAVHGRGRPGRARPPGRGLRGRPDRRGGDGPGGHVRAYSGRPAGHSGRGGPRRRRCDVRRPLRVRPGGAGGDRPGRPGNSRLVAGLTPADVGYAEVRAALNRRGDQLERLAADGRTDPGAVVRAAARRRADG